MRRSAKLHEMTRTECSLVAFRVISWIVPGLSPKGSIMKRILAIGFCLLFITVAVTVTQAQNWPQFRGPGATGVVEGRTSAVTWDAAKSVNTRWKTAIPGLAHSSPVIWGDKIFVTTSINSAEKDETRFGLFGDVAPVKGDLKHTWKV